MTNKLVVIINSLKYKLQLPPEPLNRGLPPPDPRSLSSTEFVESPPEKIPGYATDYTRRQINKYQDMIAWTRFKDDWKYDPNRDFQKETKSKRVTRKTKIKMQMIGHEICHAVGRKNMKTEFRWSFIGAEIERETWLLDYQHKVKTSK
jgi:hypothetical protein